jgi:hypothetical protein
LEKILPLADPSNTAKQRIEAGSVGLNKDL